MAIHYFHCTDGTDLIVDRSGSDARGVREVRQRARDAADEIMRAVPGYHEWQDWAVHVYDARGEVEIMPFLREDRAEPAPPQKTQRSKAGSTEACHSPA